MKIKYTEWYETIDVRLPELNYCGSFRRNVWKEVADKVGAALLKSSMFICEKDLQFSKEELNTPKHFGLNRFGALGDLIQLLPIVRYLKRQMHHRITLITQKIYVPIFKPFPDFEDVIPQGCMDKSNYDRVFYLDGVLETDHSLTSDQRLQHRVHIFEDFFGIKCDTYDFSFPHSADAERYAKGLLNAANL